MASKGFNAKIVEETESLKLRVSELEKAEIRREYELFSLHKRLLHETQTYYEEKLAVA
jgi:hypothetical protein